MLARCFNPAHHAFANYGGRGIGVCDAWRASFEAFFADVGSRPRSCSLDRIDNSRGYEPGNVRWATRSEQNRNRRNALTVELSLSVIEWSVLLGIGYDTIRNRVIVEGFDPLEALFGITRDGLIRRMRSVVITNANDQRLSQLVDDPLKHDSQSFGAGG